MISADKLHAIEMLIACQGKINISGGSSGGVRIFSIEGSVDEKILERVHESCQGLSQYLNSEAPTLERRGLKH